jgi:hypothetical protein
VCAASIDYAALDIFDSFVTMANVDDLIDGVPTQPVNDERWNTTLL